MKESDKDDFIKESDKDAFIRFFKIFLPFLAFGVVALAMEGYSKVEIILFIWNICIGFGFLFGVVFAIGWGCRRSVWQGWLLGLIIFFVYGILTVEI